MLDFVDNDCLKENIVFILLLKCWILQFCWLQDSLLLLDCCIFFLLLFVYFTFSFSLKNIVPGCGPSYSFSFSFSIFLYILCELFFGGNGFSGIRSSFTALILFRKVSIKLADFLPLEVGVFSMFNRQWEGVWTKLFESSIFWFGTNGNRIDLTS